MLLPRYATHYGQMACAAAAGMAGIAAANAAAQQQQQQQQQGQHMGGREQPSGQGRPQQQQQQQHLRWWQDPQQVKRTSLLHCTAPGRPRAGSALQHMHPALDQAVRVQSFFAVLGDLGPKHSGLPAPYLR